MKIQRYFPGFVDTRDEEPIISEFDSIESLKEIPWVKSWSDPIASGSQFDKYSLSGDYLMAELKEPRQWWVVGILLDHYNLDLPKLVAKK